ncbi:MAG: hypothetical protein ABI614_04215 [Planctomycetota bacterium]
MSTAAHEPRRVGPRRAESPSGSKVTPRRNAPEASELDSLRYDSDELPVLIRLPNLRDLGSVEMPPASPSKKKRHRVDPPSAVNQKASKQTASTVTKKSFQQHASNNKLVLVGIAGGILVGVLLFMFNSGSSKPPADEDGWASEAAELRAPEITLPTETEPPQPYPGFKYEAPVAATTPYTGNNLAHDSDGVPDLQIPSAPLDSKPADLPSRPQPIAGWPSDEAMQVQTTSGSTPVDLWPGEELISEKAGYEYPAANSPSQTDYRSSMYPSDAESYRMGKLNSDRPQATQGDHSSILNGNIEIPDTTSIR